MNEDYTASTIVLIRSKRSWEIAYLTIARPVLWPETPLKRDSESKCNVVYIYIKKTTSSGNRPVY